MGHPPASRHPLHNSTPELLVIGMLLVMGLPFNGALRCCGEQHVISGVEGLTLQLCHGLLHTAAKNSSGEPTLGVLFLQHKIHVVQRYRLYSSALRM